MRRRHGQHAKPSVTAPLVQQSFVLTLSTGISAGAGFAAWSIAAHSATPHAVGIAAGLFSSCSLLSYLTSLALPYGLLHYGNRVDARGVLSLAMSVTAVTSVAGAAVFTLGSRWWAPALAPELDHLYAFVVYAGLNVAVAAAALIDAYFIARRRAGLVCARNLITAVGKVGGLTVLAVKRLPHPTAICLAMLVPVAASVACASVPIATAPVSTRDYKRALPRALFDFSLKNYPGALLDGAPTFLLPVIVLRFVGPTANAYFYVAWSISSAVGLVAAAVGQVTLRETSGVNNRQILAKRAMIIALAATGFAVLVLYCAGPLVLHIFGSSYISRATVPLRLMLLSTIPGAHLTITIALLRGQRRSAAVTQASFAYAALSIGATVALGAVAGVNGVCVGWLVGVTLAAVIVALISARHPEAQVKADGNARITLEEAV
jgi:O-antigen/teichoic acid export membrane protein